MSAKRDRCSVLVCTTATKYSTAFENFQLHTRVKRHPPQTHFSSHSCTFDMVCYATYFNPILVEKISEAEACLKKKILAVLK